MPSAGMHSRELSSKRFARPCINMLSGAYVIATAVSLAALLQESLSVKRPAQTSCLPARVELSEQAVVAFTRDPTLATFTGGLPATHEP